MASWLLCDFHLSFVPCALHNHGAVSFYFFIILCLEHMQNARLLVRTFWLNHTTSIFFSFVRYCCAEIWTVPRIARIQIAPKESGCKANSQKVQNNHKIEKKEGNGEDKTKRKWKLAQKRTEFTCKFQSKTESKCLDYVRLLSDDNVSMRCDSRELLFTLTQWKCVII